MPINDQFIEQIRSEAYAVVDDICALDHAFTQDADGRKRCIKPDELAILLDVMSSDFSQLRTCLRRAGFPPTFFDQRDEFATLSSGNPGSMFWLVLLHAGVILDTLGLMSSGHGHDGEPVVTHLDELADRILEKQQWIADWWSTLPRLSKEELRGYVDSQCSRLDRAADFYAEGSKTDSESITAPSSDSS